MYICRLEIFPEQAYRTYSQPDGGRRQPPAHIRQCVALLLQIQREKVLTIYNTHSPIANLYMMMMVMMLIR